MRTLLLFIIICFLVTGTLYGALHAKEPLLLYAITAAVAVLFARYLLKRQRKQATRRNMENYFLLQYRQRR